MMGVYFGGNMRTRTFNAAVRLGKSVRIGRHALPTLALAAAQGAARSVVDEHDASDKEQRFTAGACRPL